MMAIMTSKNSTIFIAATLILWASTQSTMASGTTTQSAASPGPTAVIDTTTPYVIEFTGWDDSRADPDARGGWGVDVATTGYGTVLSKPNIGYNMEGSTPPPINFTQCNEGTYEILHTSTNLDPNPPPLLALSDAFILSPSYSFQETSNSSNCTSFKQIETVPFALNIGLNEVYDGSIVLGGWYDANRIASTSWYLVPESVGNSSFLETGMLEISVMVGSQSYPALLDYNFGTWWSFPSDLYGACLNGSLVISFPGTSGQNTLDIPIDAIFRINQCLVDSGPPEPGPIQLGIQFFQAAYIYVDTTGQVYLTAANSINPLSISMEPFDANATLKLPVGVTAYTAAPSPTSKAISRFAPGFGNLPYGIGWNVVLLGLLVAWITD